MRVLSTHPSDHRGTNALKRVLSDIYSPNWVVAYGDRHDMLRAVLEAHYDGKKIIHVGGGETRHLDDLAHPDHRTRDAISMIARVHFTANPAAWQNVAALGCGDDDIYVSGCPSLDEVVAYNKTLNPKRVRAGVFVWLPESVDGFKPNDAPRLSEQDFLQRIAHCELFRTNSSAGLREAPIFGTPVEMVGDRQRGRVQGPYHHREGGACALIRKIVMEVCR